MIAKRHIRSFFIAMPTPSLVFDPRDPDVIQRPLETLLRLQAEDPVHWSPLLKGWVLTRHDDVKAVQMNSGITSDRLTPFFESQQGEERARLNDLIRYLNTWVVYKDPPDHTRLRKLDEGQYAGIVLATGGVIYILYQREFHSDVLAVLNS